MTQFPVVANDKLKALANLCVYCNNKRELSELIKLCGCGAYYHPTCLKDIYAIRDLFSAKKNEFNESNKPPKNDITCQIFNSRKYYNHDHAYLMNFALEDGLAEQCMNCHDQRESIVLPELCLSCKADLQTGAVLRCVYANCRKRVHKKCIDVTESKVDTCGVFNVGKSMLCSNHHCATCNGQIYGLTGNLSIASLNAMRNKIVSKLESSKEKNIPLLHYLALFDARFKKMNFYRLNYSSDFTTILSEKNYDFISNTSKVARVKLNTEYYYEEHNQQLKSSNQRSLHRRRNNEDATTHDGDLNSSLDEEKINYEALNQVLMDIQCDLSKNSNISAKVDIMTTFLSSGVSCVVCGETFHTNCIPVEHQMLSTNYLVCFSHIMSRCFQAGVRFKYAKKASLCFCVVCGLSSVDSATEDKLLSCDYCPRAFHALCITHDPIVKNALAHKPDLFKCTQCSAAKRPLVGEIIWAKYGNQGYWPAIVLHPSNLPPCLMKTSAVNNLEFNRLSIRFIGETSSYATVYPGHTMNYSAMNPAYLLAHPSTKITKKDSLQKGLDVFNLMVQKNMIRDSILQTLNASRVLFELESPTTAKYNSIKKNITGDKYVHIESNYHLSTYVCMDEDDLDHPCHCKTNTNLLIQTKSSSRARTPALNPPTLNPPTSQLEHGNEENLSICDTTKCINVSSLTECSPNACDKNWCKNQNFSTINKKLLSLYHGAFPEQDVQLNPNPMCVLRLPVKRRKKNDDQFIVHTNDKNTFDEEPLFIPDIASKENETVATNNTVKHRKIKVNYINVFEEYDQVKLIQQKVSRGLGIYPNCGWGLKAGEDILMGEFIIEYVGEIINKKKMMERLTNYNIIREPNYYILCLNNQFYVDAGPKGNHARFINHSCDPNCETQKWTVNGLTRIGIFATQNIAKGEIITFDYKFDYTNNLTDKKVECHCKTASCSGFIGLKKVKERKR